MAASSAVKRPSVLFICLGNICRSPIAEALFLKLIEDKKERHLWKVDSAATGDWHIGHGPDPRTMETLKSKGITNYNHIVRQVTKEDFSEFDYIIGMDHNNIRDLKEVQPKNAAAQLVIFGDYDTEKTGPVIEDPYFGDDINDFYKVFDKVSRCCIGFYNEIISNSAK